MITGKKLATLTLRFSMDLIADVSAWKYPQGSSVRGHYYPTINNENKRDAIANVPDNALASRNGGLRAQSAYIRQPKDRI